MVVGVMDVGASVDLTIHLRILTSYRIKRMTHGVPCQNPMNS